MKNLSVFMILFMVFLLVGCNLPQAPIDSYTLSNTENSTVIPSETPTPTLTATPTQIPTITPTPTPSSTPTPTLTATPTPIVLPTTYKIKSGDTLYSISVYFGVSMIYIALANKIENTGLIIAGTDLYIPDPNNLPPGLLPVGKKILVVLSEQKVYVSQDNKIIKEFLISSGLPKTPTVIGKFKIMEKLVSTEMSGEGYDLKDVPWVMYFYKDYGLHGTYWHSNFGHPMSHGCVNMKTEDAKWLYDWASIGTEVEVIP